MHRCLLLSLNVCHRGSGIAERIFVCVCDCFAYRLWAGELWSSLLHHRCLSLFLARALHAMSQ
jgi:hypothetical protein